MPPRQRSTVALASIALVQSAARLRSTAAITSGPSAGRLRSTVALATIALTVLVWLPAGAAAAETSLATPTLVVMLGGYNSSLASAQLDFQPLTAALAARQPGLRFAHYSYTGSLVQGCSVQPNDYAPADTAQDIHQSERILIATLEAVAAACPTGRVVLVGHSLGGLIAFQALADHPIPGVSDIATLDSPLGGAPGAEVQNCVAWALCADGPIDAYLAQLAGAWQQTAADNAATAARLAAAGTRVTAWGNQNDCMYDAALCGSLAATLSAGYDARETQWLGMPRVVRNSYPVPQSIWNISITHRAVLLTSSGSIAADLLP